MALGTLGYVLKPCMSTGKKSDYDLGGLKMREVIVLWASQSQISAFLCYH